jgi:uncharacterized short protein YbdD (DUF466 family)
MKAIAEAVRMLRRIAGMPDYAAYVEHLRERHPERPVLNEREFFETWINRRYNGVNRCC